ncbi:MAG: alpha/beta fold hydrolase [Acidimicrobiales bacterium]
MESEPGEPLVEAVDVNAHPVAWREAGAGDTIVFLHGLGGTRTAWEPQLAGLGDTWRCVAWDMPGYGASANDKPLTFPAIAAAVVGLLDALGVDRVHLCGLSFGGQQALHTVLEYPERVASLVLADTSAAFGMDGTDPATWKRARLRPLEQGSTPADIAERAITAVAAPGFGGVHRAEAVAAFSRITSAGLRAACECLPSHDVRSRLAEIVAPTLVVVGELDQETPPLYSEMLAAGIGSSTLEVIPGVGHLTPSEAPTAFNRLVRAFLQDRTTVRT